MSGLTNLKRRLGALALGLAAFGAAGGVIYVLSGLRSNATAGAAAPPPPATGELAPVTASLTLPARAISRATGLPLPRFVSLKTGKVNVRRGPSSEHPVAWVFNRKGMPVEIIAEFEHWRRVRDSEGEEGWIYQSLLSGHRTAIIAPWRSTRAVALRQEPAVASGLVANIGSGVVGRITRCDGNWCKVNLGGYKGWVAQNMLWGVYPGEKIKN